MAEQPSIVERVKALQETLMEGGDNPTLTIDDALVEIDHLLEALVGPPPNKTAFLEKVAEWAEGQFAEVWYQRRAKNLQGDGQVVRRRGESEARVLVGTEEVEPGVLRLLFQGGRTLLVPDDDLWLVRRG